MSIETVRVRSESEPPKPEQLWSERRVIDVSEVDAREVRAYARASAGEVYFERKGGRTFLVAA